MRIYLSPLAHVRTTFNVPIFNEPQIAQPHFKLELFSSNAIFVYRSTKTVLLSCLRN